MQERRAEAVSYYQKVKATRDFDSDAVSQRQAQRLLQAPMNNRERLLVLGRNAFDSGRYEEAHTILRAGPRRRCRRPRRARRGCLSAGPRFSCPGTA